MNNSYQKTSSTFSTSRPFCTLLQRDAPFRNERGRNTNLIFRGCVYEGLDLLFANICDRVVSGDYNQISRLKVLLTLRIQGYCTIHRTWKREQSSFQRRRGQNDDCTLSQVQIHVILYHLQLNTEREFYCTVHSQIQSLTTKELCCLLLDTNLYCMSQSCTRFCMKCPIFILPGILNYLLYSSSFPIFIDQYRLWSFLFFGLRA